MTSCDLSYTCLRVVKATPEYPGVFRHNNGINKDDDTAFALVFPSTNDCHYDHNLMDPVFSTVDSRSSRDRKVRSWE